MTLSSDRADILQTAHGLRPIQLEARFDWWRKGGLPGGAAGEMVSRSRGLPMPAFDRTDRSILAAEKAYREAVEGARKMLGLAMAIQQTWLILDAEGNDVTIHVATRDEAAQASDLGVDCRRCKRPVACTPADRLRAGLCFTCYQAWRRAGMPDLPPADAKGATVDAARADVV